MELPKSKSLVQRLEYLASVDSTNLELGRMNASSSLPNFTALVSGSQTGGLGRMGRAWVSEPNSSISMSLLLRSKAKKEQLSWVNLIAGVSVQATISSLSPKSKVSVKWPNDVLVEGKKISGILSQLQEDGSLVLGVGINLLQQEAAPEHAISLSELGVQATFDEVLALFLTHFRARWAIFQDSPELAIKKTRGELEQVCSTLGQAVRAELPGGKTLHGIASEIDELGQLVILTPERVALAAADVWHLRN